VRSFSVVLAFLIAAGTVHGETLFERGDVVVQSSASSPFGPPYPDYADLSVADSFGQEKAIDGRFELPPFAGGLLFLDQQRALYVGPLGVTSWTDGISVRSVFLGPLNLHATGEILQMRSGDLITAERYRLGGLPRIVRFNSSGDVLWVYELTGAPPRAWYFGSEPNSFVGAEHFDVLRDQCTLLWTPGPSAARNGGIRVRVFDICTGRAASDFTTLPPEIEQLGAIRALPNGDVLIATPVDIRRFNAAGQQVAEYRAPVLFGRLMSSAPTFLALTPDASGFWAAVGDAVQRIDFASPDLIAARFRMDSGGTINLLAVVGEWRASLATPRRRSAGH